MRENTALNGLGGRVKVAELNWGVLAVCAMSIAADAIIHVQGRTIAGRAAKESRHGAGGGLRILRAGIPVAGANTGRLGARGYRGVVLL